MNDAIAVALVFAAELRRGFREAPAAGLRFGRRIRGKIRCLTRCAGHGQPK
jgi:hypothetical protein